MTVIDLGHPTSGDVLDLILEDHRRFEDLLRRLRDVREDRDALRRAFAELHVAHARAEEELVYPKLRKRDAITEHEAEHGEEEHAEGHQALLDVLRARDLTGERFDDLLESLAATVSHHLVEEELSIINPAWDEVAEAERAELGQAFARRRNELLEAGCASVGQVAEIVGEAEREGLLDD